MPTCDLRTAAVVVIEVQPRDVASVRMRRTVLALVVVTTVRQVTLQQLPVARRYVTVALESTMLAEVDGADQDAVANGNLHNPDQCKHANKINSLK